LSLAYLQEEKKVCAELRLRVGVGDTSLAHHTSLLGGGGVGFLLGSGRNWFVAYLLSGDCGNDFTSCAHELGISPLAHRV
jgi:hypothetical protein